MKALENQTFLIAYIISNALAIIFFIAALKRPRICRFLFSVLFGWASWANWNMAINNPHDYLNYADLAFLEIYKTFITGWFSDHIQIAVSFIATGQALIAISLLLKGLIYKLGLIGGIIFLIAIIPLGIGSAFPCTLILAISLGLMLNQDQYIWKHEQNKFIMSID
ncbi:MAG: hypothetical protein ACXWCG_03740 [Flavitalea sp.]